MMFEYKKVWPYLKKKGLLISDAISYAGAFKEFSRLKKHKGIIFKDLGIIKKWPTGKLIIRKYMKHFLIIFLLILLTLRLGK